MSLRSPADIAATPAADLEAETLERVREALRIERDALDRLAASVDEAAARAVECVLSRRGQVIVTGMGKAGHIARKAAATLSSTGTPAYFLHPAEALHGDLGLVSERNTALALSNSGETEELLALLPHLKRLGAAVIAITGNVESSLARHADITIATTVEREADPLGIAPTASTTAMVALCDALAAALVWRRGFSAEQFAIFHPGGNLGRKLLWLTRDLMHGGDLTPIVPESATLREALLVMTSKRLGCAFAVDPDGRLGGILTDGDLRRVLQGDHIGRESEVFDAPLSDFATRNPKTVAPERLAAEALKIMEDHKITALPVVDADGRPVGALHLHDLVRAGLA